MVIVEVDFSALPYVLDIEKADCNITFLFNITFIFIFAPEYCIIFIRMVHGHHLIR
jgi:hypothetical protein